jgi:3-dehydroquinate synthase
LLTRCGLPTVPERWAVDQLLATMRSDKKAIAGRLRFVLPRALGGVEMVDGVPEADVVAVVQESTA